MREGMPLLDYAYYHQEDMAETSLFEDVLFYR